MNVEDESPEYTNVQEKMAAVLREAAPLWGPRSCPHSSDWYICEVEECTFADTEPKQNVILHEFIVIGVFMDMENGHMDMAHVAPPRQPWHHTVGMVRTWQRDCDA